MPSFCGFCSVKYFGTFKFQKGEAVSFNIRNKLEGFQGSNVKGIDDWWISRNRLDQLIDEGENFFYSIMGNDIDGDPLSYSFSLDQDIESEITGNLLNILFDDDFNGECEVTVIVSDQEFQDVGNFTITVNPVNDAPVVENPILDLNLNEDFDEYSIDISNTFSDIDMDDLEYSYSIDQNDFININIIGRIYIQFIFIIIIIII